MKVWLVEHLSYGEVSVYDENVNVWDIPIVKQELDALVDGYKEEHADFVVDVAMARQHGRGEASIEERLNVSLVDVETL